MALGGVTGGVTALVLAAMCPGVVTLIVAATLGGAAAAGSRLYWPAAREAQCHTI